nr:PREDICTED: DENN domain-containing protein 3-like [Paralichthys olivaceus]
MAELPSGLLEACVVFGAPSDKLRDIYQLHQQNKLNELPLLDAEVLQVHAPPFVTKETNSNQAIGPAFSRVQRRKSFIKKKRRDRVAETLSNGDTANRAEVSSVTEDISVPKDLDLIALPQLCFPGGLQLANEQKDDSYHFLVFTDLFGNRTHGVVVQYYRAVQFCQEGVVQNGHRWTSSKSRLYAPFAVCVISKFPYYNALRECLSCLLVQLRPARQGDIEETVKEFSAKLSLVPLPPPGQLHVSFSLRPLQVVLPSREDQDSPVIDIDLHLPFLCFTHTTLLQVLSCLLQEQRLVFFSSDWARLTLVAESLLLYLQPLSWQQPYVPVLSRGMLDFLMAPTAFLMGCHISHFEEVAAETEDLILVNVDDGFIQSSCSETIDLPAVPLSAAESFMSRFAAGHQRQVGPELFRVFYTIWKETEAEAQEVCLPASVLEHIEPSECVFKLSSSVKTGRGVGKIAMTQRRLFLLTDGRPGYVEVAQYRDLEEVKVSSAPFLLLRIPSLKLRVRGRKEAFEANLKTETELWNLMVKEMWAGRNMADQHKDPQYMQQALTNALLMDAVVGSLQSSKAIYAASKLAHFDRIKTEVPMMVPKTTAETLKHKINPSLELAAPQPVDVLLYTPGQLWVSVSGGKVMVFDASSWSLTHTCQVGKAKLNCMLGVDKDQVWMGSEDFVIYIISIVAMVCNRQLTEHRGEVTGLALDTDKYSQKVAYSCSAEGTVMVWDISTLQVKRHFRLSCDRLVSVSGWNGKLWCCSRDSIMEVWRNGSLKHRLNLPDQQKGITATFSSVLLLPEREELWSVCVDSGEVCIWCMKDPTKPFHRVALQDCTGCYCMIKVKNQVWVGGVGRSSTKGKIYILDAERRLVLKELHGHSDKVTALCSAEDRYVLSGAGKHDGKVAIWKVE